MSHDLSVRRRTAAVLIGAGALAGVLLSGAGVATVVVANRAVDGGLIAPVATPDAGSTPAPAADGSGPPRAGCPRNRDSTMPTAPSATVRWQPVGLFHLPTTGDAYGPCAVTSTTASGYARTPGGVLIAAAQLVTRSEVYEPVAVATDTVRSHYVPGPLRDRLLNHIATHADEPMSPDGTGQVVAYSIPLFTPHNATVTLAYAADGYPGVYVRVTAVLQWLDGDWRVVAPEDPADVGQLATSIVGMTPFSRT